MCFQKFLIDDETVIVNDCSFVGEEILIVCSYWVNPFFVHSAVLLELYVQILSGIVKFYTYFWLLYAFFLTAFSLGDVISDRTTPQQHHSESVSTRAITEIIYLAAQLNFTADFHKAQKDFDSGNKDSFNVRLLMLFNSKVYYVSET